MATTIVSQPKRFSFSKNLMPLKINTDLGIGATVKISVAYALNNGLGGVISAVDLYSETLTADSNGDVVFYLQNQLDVVLSNYIPKWGDGVKMMKGNWATYIVSYVDFDALGNSGGTVGWIGDTQGDEYFVYNGGISYEQWQPGSYFDYLDTDKLGDHTQRFWTWFENGREVGINEPHWLSFMSVDSNGYTSPTLVAKCYYEDGTNATFSKLIPILSNSLKGELYIIPSGFDMLVSYIGGSMSRYNGSNSKVIKYEVWLYENDGASEPFITEKKLFMVDWVYHKRAKHFIFANSIGGIDSIRLYFRENMGAEYLSIQAKSLIKFDYYTNTPLPIVNGNYSIEEQVYKKANSGETLRKSDLDAMRQLALSGCIYEIIKPGKLNPLVRFLPINSTSKKIAYYQRMPNSPIYQLELEYQYSFSNVSYTPEDLDCSSADLPALYSSSDYFAPLGGGRTYFQINFQIAALGIVRYAGPTENLTSGAAMELWMNNNWGDVATFEWDGANHMICKSAYPITMFTVL